MNRSRVNVVSNGFALFDPVTLEGFYENKKGLNLLNRFITTDDGDIVINRGIVLPIINIPSGTYNVIIKEDQYSIDEEQYVWKESGVYPLAVETSVHLADLGQFIEWNGSSEVNSFKIPDLEKGFYEAKVKMYSSRSKKGPTGDAGYIIELKKSCILPVLTADLSESMVL